MSGIIRLASCDECDALFDITDKDVELPQICTGRIWGHGNREMRVRYYQYIGRDLENSLSAPVWEDFIEPEDREEGDPIPFDNEYRCGRCNKRSGMMGHWNEVQKKFTCES